MTEQPIIILTKAYEKAVQHLENQSFDVLIPIEIKEYMDIFISKIDTDKSLVQVIITSVLKKIINPKQDIRLHMAKFKNGYSARVLDTQVTTPFFKQHFPKYANKETAFLTKATRAELKWTLKEGQKLPFRSQALIEPFLKLIDFVQNTADNDTLNSCLIYLFRKLIAVTAHNQVIFDEAIATADVSGVLNINTVLTMLETHFSTKLSSRLPVIAIYAAYQQVALEVKRYDKKVLRPLNVHTSADKHGYGDIEIWNDDETPFEMIEIKHNIPIDRNLVFDVAKKSENTTIQRYYILTTYKNSFASVEEEVFINQFILQIKKQRGIDIIANGIIHTLKYYLRFIDNYHSFLKNYTQALINDAQKSTEVKDFHIQKWQEILIQNQV